MGLFGLFSKKKQKRAKVTKKNTNFAGERLDRLTSDGNLPFGWVTYNKSFIKLVEDENDRDLKRVFSYEEPVKKCEALRMYLIGIEDKKKRYSRIGVCEGKYFEYYICESAQMENLKREYVHLKNNIKKEQKEYEERKRYQEVILPNLTSRLIVLIKDNPGILQTDAYKYFDPEDKMHVSGILSNMEREGVIIRTKSGRTYSLNMNK